MIKLVEVIKMKKIPIARITRIALMAAFIVIGAQIALPQKPPFTLQTFFIFLISVIMKPADAVFATLVYIGLGAVGVPVFSGFQGGFGVILGAGGGFIISFPIMAFICSTLLRKFKRNVFARTLVFVIATIVSYIFGIAWILIMNHSVVEPSKFFLSYVFPFMLGDILKIAAAVFCTMKLEKVLKHEKKNNKPNKA